MLVLGIDPGIGTTGYGLVRDNPDGSLETVEYGVLLTPAHVSQDIRLLDLHTQLTNLLLLHQPESAAVEKLFFYKNVTTAMAVGQARGVILMTLAQYKLPVFEYTPLEVKMAVTGYGNADKAQVQLMVKAMLGLEKIPKPDDAADALAIAICHGNCYKMKRLEQS
ncbi:MAG TPA: crossover junction endodeoxyribonuclease RuvC [Anaerolineaceae bacterium]